MTKDILTRAQVREIVNGGDTWTYPKDEFETLAASHEALRETLDRNAYKKSDLAAIAIAHDELRSYLETVGEDGSLDDEEIPFGKLRWAERRLRSLLERSE